MAKAMKARGRLLDSRYLEFLDYLQRMGQLQSITRMINCLSGQQDGDTIYSMYSFWRKGWIEVRETEKMSKTGLEKEYAVKVRLASLEEFFRQRRLSCES